ncbi:hypothetical protein PYW08_004601 [Mythimna loreyi]|uniref:Uncharacterized protein n=1 Tax=Mythimna loreyi TaxID=667449 RepID=A0ACC2QQE1_9NEOP|nr:hypothetical protein PYW08_004601 [Mythimna loreyi]
MKDFLVLLLINCLCSIVLGTSDDENSNKSLDEEDEEEDNENAIDESDDQGQLDGSAPPSNCWMTLDAANHLNIMDRIDDNYFDVRHDVQEALEERNFDKKMIKGFRASRGAAYRELNAHQTRMIPSGINLGGFCMLRMPESVLFFHRMKLRNNTFFTVQYLHNDLTSMVIRINLGLNDIHLKGAYERTLNDLKPNVLLYSPTFGEVEFLLKDVKYKIEGRYRVVRNRLLIELISSEILCDDILMTYVTQAIESTPARIEKENLGGFLSKMKTDLDLWLKDYFNDYLTLEADTEGIPEMAQLAKYDQEKTVALEDFTDQSINAIVTRIRLLNAETIRVPSFTFKTIHGLQIKLFDGVLHGLDTMYRRSVPTGLKQKKIRKVDSVVGFSNLKVVYKYEALVPTAVPPLTGLLTLSANELTAHLALAMVKDPETVDLDIEFLGQAKPEALTLEGGANILIANFKHLLEHQILSVMSNSLIYSVIMLKSLPRCEPFLPGHILKKDKKPDTNYPDPETSDEENNDLRKRKHSRQSSHKEQQKPIMKQSTTQPPKAEAKVNLTAKAGDNLKKNQTEQKKLRIGKKKLTKKTKKRRLLDVFIKDLKSH